MDKVIFNKPPSSDFFKSVKKKVEEVFKSRKISRHANAEQNFKTFCLLLIYGLLYGALITNQVAGMAIVATYGCLGFITGLIGFNFSHDVMHGAYFASPRWNYFWSYLFDFNGTSSYIWKITHNGLHHTYTNIPKHDEDIEKAILLRLSPEDKLYAFHRFQPFYAFFLYAFTSLNWVFYSDYAFLWKEHKKQGVPFREIVLFFIFKALYLIFFLIIPMAVIEAPAYVILGGFIMMHVVGGFSIAIIFQLAHIVEGVEFPTPDKQGHIDRPWVLHEMATTSDFARDSYLCSILFGGLNYQIEHHLFPYVAHTHYRWIAPIVKETALSLGVPYLEQPSLMEAIASHYRQLKKLSK